MTIILYTCVYVCMFVYVCVCLLHKYFYEFVVFHYSYVRFKLCFIIVSSFIGAFSPPSSKKLDSTFTSTHASLICGKSARLWCGESSDRSLMVEPLSYFSFQPVLHDWCNKGRGMCYPVSGMVHIKDP